MFARDVYTEAGPRDRSQMLLWSPEGRAQTAGNSRKGTVPAPKALTLFIAFVLSKAHEVKWKTMIHLSPVVNP